jgi:hypothetical protein
MDTIISYETVKALVANPPSLGDCPNFFNLRALQNNFARTLKQIICPQSPVNGWAGFVLTPAMYALINPKRFDLKLLNLPMTTGVPKFLPIYAADGTTVIPYMCKQTLCITAAFTRQKNYYNTACNVYHAVYDTLDTHVDNAFKVAPPTNLPTIGWNASMLLNDIFDQLMKTYGRPMPDAMQQNMMTFLAPYNPQDPPEILFKHCANCQEVAIIANVKYTNKQLLMNVINLLTQCSLYQRDLNDWDCKPDAEKMWLNLRPFIQEVYQHHFAYGNMTTGQGGYASCNCFAGFASNAGEDNILDDDTAKTIAMNINSHMANLSTQTAASLKANAMQINTSLQWLANNNAQLHPQQQLLMQQMAMLTTNAPTTCNNTYVALPTQIYAPPPLHGFQQQSYYPHRGDGRGKGCSHGGRVHCACGGGGRGTLMPPPIPYVGTNIPYIPAGANPPPRQRNPNFSNIVKAYANQNVCYLRGFDVEDWHTSATCKQKKSGHQDGFTCSNYMEYKRANHPFSQKAMHKTMYPSSF